MGRSDIPCDFCKQVPPPGESLKQCGRCNLRFYCSKNCQVTDWPDHKTKCMILKQGALQRVFDEFKRVNAQKKRDDPNSISTEDEVAEFEAFVEKHKPTVEDCECMDDRQLAFAKAARESRCAFFPCSQKMPRTEQFSFSMFTMKNAPCKLSHAIPMQFCSLVCVDEERKMDEQGLFPNVEQVLPEHLQPPPPPASMLLSSTNSTAQSSEESK